MELRDNVTANHASPPTALLLSGDNNAEDRKVRELLDFFGISWSAVSMDECAAGILPPQRGNYNVISSAPALARTLQGGIGSASILPEWIRNSRSMYISGFESSDICKGLLRLLTGDTHAAILNLSKPGVLMSISRDHPEVCGPMSGMKVSVDLTDGEVLFSLDSSTERLQSVIVTREGQVFVKVTFRGIPIYLNSSCETVDISARSETSFDVRKHFCGAVPIAMYLKCIFRDVCWSNPETNACLIIDDPPLKPRYGFLHFGELSQLMDEQNFTTAMAFIPWNWRRTDRETVDLLRSRPAKFSLAVHGCDHTAREFATRSPAVLDKKIWTAKQRMDFLVQRTSLRYDRVMVFPQGVFSPETGRSLKLNGFIAAVNTEVAPSVRAGNETRVRDLWDVANMKYGTFPIFTRRYSSAGIENFAFDALLGKPCLIAAHHDVFKDHGCSLAEFVRTLNCLNWSLRWRPLGEALAHSAKMRAEADATIAIRMFAATLVVENATDMAYEAALFKAESDSGAVEAVTVNQKAVDFHCDSTYLRFHARLLPKGTCRVCVTYFQRPHGSSDGPADRIGYMVRTGLRRYLSEFRDNYICQRPALYELASRIKQRLMG